MELYRAHLYESIGLDAGLLGGSLDGSHTTDVAWAGGAQHAAASCTAAAAECQPVQASVTGPDGRSYRVDSYVRLLAAGSGPVGGREVKKVTVVVRRGDNGQTLTRLSSTFDKSTGCKVSGSPC
jgi:hypothetical protein